MRDVKHKAFYCMTSYQASEHLTCASCGQGASHDRPLHELERITEELPARVHKYREVRSLLHFHTDCLQSIVSMLVRDDHYRMRVSENQENRVELNRFNNSQSEN